MNTPSMPQGSKSAVSEWLDSATQLKQTVLDRIATMPEAARIAAPGPGAWSASEVVEHLILLEEVIPGTWSERLLAAGSPKVTLRSELISRILSFSVSKTGIRVPTIPELDPQGGLELSTLDDRWSAARTGLIAALPDNPNATWVLHPVLGPLSSAQMGRIVAAHIEHHLRHWPT